MTLADKINEAAAKFPGEHPPVEIPSAKRKLVQRSGDILSQITPASVLKNGEFGFKAIIPEAVDLFVDFFKLKEKLKGKTNPLPIPYITTQDRRNDEEALSYHGGYIFGFKKKTELHPQENLIAINVNTAIQPRVLMKLKGVEFVNNPDTVGNDPASAYTYHCIRNFMFSWLKTAIEVSKNEDQVVINLHKQIEADNNHTLVMAVEGITKEVSEFAKEHFIGQMSGTKAWEKAQALLDEKIAETEKDVEARTPFVIKLN